jgi:hypothetical protein
MSTPPHAWFVEDSAERTILRTPASSWWVQGLLLIFLLPALLIFIGVLIAALEGGGDPLAFAIFGGGAALLSVPCVLWGLVLVALSGSRSRDSEVVLDWTTGTLTAADALLINLDRVQSLRVHQPNPLMKWRVLDLVLDEGEPIVLMQRLTTRRCRGIADAVAPMRARLGDVPFDLPADAATGDAVGLGDRHAALACYLPFQGIFLMASLWYVFQAKERPFVRFAAIQSLMQFVLTTTMIGGLVAGSVGLSMAKEQIGQPALVIALVGVWGLFFLFHMGSRIVASVASYRGRPIVFPWFSPFLASRRPEAVER